MDIGEPQRTFVVEPIERPVPAAERLPAAAGLAVPDLIEPVAGWRLWEVVEGRDGEVRLSSVTRDDRWPAESPLEAVCAEAHPSPSAGCRCGIHALRSPEGLFRCAGGHVAPPSPYVVGLVSLWGRVVECERGWRAEHAYPLSLCLVASGTRGDPDLERVAAGLACYGRHVEIVRGGVAAVLAGIADGEERVARLPAATLRGAS